MTLTIIKFITQIVHVHIYRVLFVMAHLLLPIAMESCYKISTFLAYLVEKRQMKYPS